MSLVLALGSNLENRLDNLKLALERLEESFNLIYQDHIYETLPVDYLDQPAFLNQVVEFEIPPFGPIKTLEIILDLEKAMGRTRDIDKGPRLIDIDIIFFGNEILNYENLTIPHPRWDKRDFIFEAIKNLPYYENLKSCYDFPKTTRALTIYQRNSSS